MQRDKIKQGDRFTESVNTSDFVYVKKDVTRREPLTVRVVNFFRALKDWLFPIDYILFNTTPQETTQETGAVYWNQDDETIDVIVNPHVTLQVGQEVFLNVKNQTGGDLLNGYAAMFAGALGNSGRILAQYGIADGSLLPSYTIGVFTETIADGTDGKVTWFGKVRGINTTGSLFGETWNDGDILYVSPTTAGHLTKVRPEAPLRAIEIAAVVHAHSNGILFVRPTWSPKLTELDDFDGGVPVDRDLIHWDSALNAWNPISLQEAGIEYTYVEIDDTDSPYTASHSEFVSCNAATNPITVNLPAAVGYTSKRIVVHKSDNTANAITVDANASETINGELTRTLTTQWESMTLFSNGSNWLVI